MGTDERKIERMARACAADAIKQGCTFELLTDGWDLASGDYEAIVAHVGRELTDDERGLARDAFDRVVRFHTGG
ncbi:MAG: hypothetical protein KJ977_05345 [Candidatus Omnitrophica bacterium]|nr:hypothetical protein [Candidatus Omnitrophota bacterium]